MLIANQIYKRKNTYHKTREEGKSASKRCEAPRASFRELINRNCLNVIKRQLRLWWLYWGLQHAIKPRCVKTRRFQVRPYLQRKVILLDRKRTCSCVSVSLIFFKLTKLVRINTLSVTILARSMFAYVRLKYKFKGQNKAFTINYKTIF